jgi:hypothetical protein
MTTTYRLTVNINGNTPIVFTNIFNNFDGNVLFVGIFIVDNLTNNVLSFTDDHGFVYPIIQGSYYINNTNFEFGFNSMSSSVLSTNYYLVNGGMPNLNFAYINNIDFITTGIFQDYFPNSFTFTLISTTCFLEDTKILCLVNDTEIYLPIQDLKSEMTIKTLHGYNKIELVGKQQIYNSRDDDIKNQLHILFKERYPELIEDLVITGSHGILVNELTMKEKIKTFEIIKNVYLTDGKFRLHACIDTRSELYKEGLFNIYHIVLYSNDKNKNYGIYANGLLVESCSKNYFIKHSNLEIF